MRKLPLWEDGRPSLCAIQKTPSRELAADCDACSLAPGARQPLGSDASDLGPGRTFGEPYLLVVGDYPTRDEDESNRVFMSKPGRHVRRLLRTSKWADRVVYDVAVRCAPGKQELKPKHVDACRPHLATWGCTADGAVPSRVVLLGPTAVLAFLGRTFPLATSRRAYCHVRWTGGEIVPVFMIQSPMTAVANRFALAAFEEDLAWATEADPPRPPWHAVARVVETEDDAVDAVLELAEAPHAAFDVETSGRMWASDFKIVCFSAAPSGGDSPWIWDRAAIDNPVTRAPLERWLRSEHAAKTGQNVKFDDLAVLSAWGIRPRNVRADVRLQRKLLEPEADASLDAMVELVGFGGMKAEAEERIAAVEKQIKNALRRPDLHDMPACVTPDVEAAIRLGASIKAYAYGLIDGDVLARYNARDALGTCRLADEFAARIAEEPALQRTWNGIVRPAARALERVEEWGVPVSKPSIESFDQYLEMREVAAKKTLDAYGAGVNWDSRDQVAKLLFENLRLPVVKRTPTGKPSTDEEALNMLSKRHPICAALVEHRFVTKLRGTYAQGLLPHVREDGRIHPNVKLDGARSGRTSCTDPNLQNIPRAADSPEGKMARDCFVARPGFKLLQLDYSQLELRIAAMLSGDPDMIEIFESGVDYHLRTAQLVSHVAWGIPPEQVTKAHRSAAKSLNFGLLYGMGDGHLAASIGGTRQQAARLREAVLGKFRKLAAWIQKQIDSTQRTGVVWTRWNGEPARRRPVWNIASKNDGERINAEHAAINSPVQGTASDFCVASLEGSVDWIESEGLEEDCKLVLPVHDSLMFEVRDHLVDEAAHVARSIMTSHDSGGVPIVVDGEVGEAWGSLVAYEF